MSARLSASAAEQVDAGGAGDRGRWMQGDGAVTHVTKQAYRGTHIVMAYDAAADTDFHRTSTGFDDVLVQHPAGMTARNIIGHARFQEDQAGRYYAAAVQVHPRWRRRGVATALYEASRATTGCKMRPAAEQTPDAKAFWATYGAKRDAAIPAPPSARARGERRAGRRGPER